MIADDFAVNLRKMIEGDNKVTSSPLVVGKPSEILSKCGANIEQDITITKKVIDKAMRPELRNKEGRMVGNTGHGLTEKQIINSIKELDSPTLVFRGRHEGSLLIITSMTDDKDRNIIIAIEFNRQEGFAQVNSIRSIYGRDKLEYFIGDSIDSGNLLAAQKQKADELLRSIGKSYPKENTFISFN